MESIIIPGSFDDIYRKVSNKNPEFKDITLGFQNVTHEQVAHLKNLLVGEDSNVVVETLDLRANRIGDLGARHIAEIIARNSTITKINIGSNNITDQGAMLIAQALKENTTLRKLNIGSNKITRPGMVEIAQALAENSALTEISCGFNNVDEHHPNSWERQANQIAKIMREHVTQNTSLTTINVGGDRGENIEYLRTITQRNEDIIPFPNSQETQLPSPCPSPTIGSEVSERQYQH